MAIKWHQQASSMSLDSCYLLLAIFFRWVSFHRHEVCNHVCTLRGSPPGPGWVDWSMFQTFQGIFVRSPYSESFVEMDRKHHETSHAISYRVRSPHSEQGQDYCSPFEPTLTMSLHLDRADQLKNRPAVVGRSSVGNKRHS